MTDEKQVAKLMKNLGITREEALEVLKDDEAINKGKDLFPLSADQEKVAKAMRQADRQKGVYKFSKRERKPNELKREIIDDLFTFLCENWPEIAQNGNISNPERQIDFLLNGENFSIQLIQHRKPKN